MNAGSPHYTVLARRFRPQTFAEVVGQTHVAQALRNAISGGRVAHAYLFTGARGVGKTSMARIFAKALNCPNAVDGNPCNACDICQAISAGQDVDVLEIDGASNRRIDDIRLLRSNVGVKPMRTHYKIYIIDEVHMLTNEAFNALLKTLEEPPPNVKFIFCTTEPNKVPETILSRCQRFDFTAIQTHKIVERLHEIAVADNCQVEPAALEIVARRAGGSMRDSQSLFDQLLAYGGQSLTVEDVHRLLGTASDERLIEIFGNLIGRQPDQVLHLFDRALAGGVQLGELVDQLLNYLRDLMVIAAGAESTELQSVAPANRGALGDQAGRWGLPTILAAMQILAETKTQMQRSGHGRTLAELALVRLTLLEVTLDLATLVNELRGGPVSAPPTPRPVPSPPAAVPRTSPPIPAIPKVMATESHPSEKADTADPDRAPSPAETVAEGDLLAQLVSMIPVKDILRTPLAKATNIAISGPNHLEICFPAGYHFEVNLCRTPNDLQRLETIAGELLGRSVRIGFKVADGPKESRPPASPEEPGQATSGGQPGKAPKPIGAANPAGRASVATSSRPGPSSEAAGPYVDAARSIFGATVVRMEKLASPNRERTSADAEDGHEE